MTFCRHASMWPDTILCLYCRYSLFHFGHILFILSTDNQECNNNTGSNEHTVYRYDTRRKAVAPVALDNKVTLGEYKQSALLEGQLYVHCKGGTSSADTISDARLLPLLIRVNSRCQKLQQPSITTQLAG